MNFTGALKYLKNFLKSLFERLFCARYIMLGLQSYRGVMCHDTELYAVFKEKSTSKFENDIRNLVNFHASSRKSENFSFCASLAL